MNIKLVDAIAQLIQSRKNGKEEGIWA